MDSIPSTSGIYKITCIANNRIYIGSAVNLRDRRNRHFNHLRQNRHHSQHLQRAWNKYGEQAFTFEVLEQVLPISLTAREQYWLNKLKPFGRKGFNIAREAGSTLGTKRSPESLKKLSQVSLDRWDSPEYIERVRQAHLGQERSPETRARLRQANLDKKMSSESIEKTRQANLGSKRSPEARENMRISHLGKKLSPETRENMRQAQYARREREKKEQST